jgi:glycosyltransferase involved in cell wall biosynthesis
LESLATGRPVVSTDVIGLGDILSEHHCGIVCPPKVEDLTNAIIRIKNDYQKVQANCKAVVEELFVKGRFISEYENLYMEVMNA